ncbi:MAG: RluA family pseudouridine synthase [Bacteroidales bacterium]|nr:RluA family pseudouridine synthase [Bacteroidales bacterium]
MRKEASRAYRQNSSDGIRIVYEDNWLLVIEKPSGMLTMSTGRQGEVTAYSMLTDYVRDTSYKRTRGMRPRVFIVHRIDRDTSGLLVFAKDQDTKEALQGNWSNAVTARTYVAVTEGSPHNNEGTVTSWLKEDPRSLVMYSSPVDNGGQKAVTHYKVLRRPDDDGPNKKSGYSLVEFELETGRKNQIRIHCAVLGCPVAGDRKYGARTSPIGRLALHARTLSFIHPWTGKEMNFSTPVPKSFKSRKFQTGTY